MTNNDFTIYSKPKYYAELISRIGKAGQGDSVALATMDFEPGDEGVPEIIDALVKAAKRGTSVRFTIDAYNFLVNGKTKIVGPLWFSKKNPRHLPPYYRKIMNSIEKIQNSGAKITLTNPPAKAFSQPFGGRSHIKYAVINNYVFIGGCNLTARSDIDLMVGWRHATTAAWLLEFAGKVDTSGSVRQALNYKDLTLDINSQTDLLIDAGVPGQSLIYDRAIELIDQAEKSIFITCQLFPNSHTARHLVRAHERGVHTTIIFNSPLHHALIMAPIHQFVTWRERARAPASFFVNQLPRSQKYLHAKLIATEKAAIIGSHNYLPSGVAFGTAEIALLREDPAFAMKAVEAIKFQLENKL